MERRDLLLNLYWLLSKPILLFIRNSAQAVKPFKEAKSNLCSRKTFTCHLIYTYGKFYLVIKSIHFYIIPNSDSLSKLLLHLFIYFLILLFTKVNRNSSFNFFQFVHIYIISNAYFSTWVCELLRHVQNYLIWNVIMGSRKKLSNK